MHAKQRDKQNNFRERKNKSQNKFKAAKLPNSKRETSKTKTVCNARETKNNCAQKQKTTWQASASTHANKTPGQKLRSRKKEMQNPTLQKNWLNKPRKLKYCAIVCARKTILVWGNNLLQRCLDFLNSFSCLLLIQQAWLEEDSSIFFPQFHGPCLCHEVRELAPVTHSAFYG